MNILDTIQIATTTYPSQENPNKNTAPGLKEPILLKRRARNTWQRTHYPVDKQLFQALGETPLVIDRLYNLAKG